MVDKVNSKLISEIVYSEADIVVNGCPTCLDTIRTGVKNKGLEIEVLDISELILRSMEGKK